MTYEPLYHKYRPQSFAELVGQDAISTTLSNALLQQRIAHAYLFTGPRGTGKTSSARILAKSLNCIHGNVPTDHPCGICNICRSITQGNALDVIEIDAASNTGVDNIRELIERSQFAPAQCRYKVYVIDECHMLSTAAFNALLKTLEEPPPRVVFVLATTDPQRVLPTIISRCQRFDFRRIPLEAMVAHLGAIAQKEAIQIQSDALQLVAQMAQGGLRDAESLLDQLSLLPTLITIDAVWDLVGAVPEQSLLHLVQVIYHGQPEQVLDSVRQLMDRGREPLIVLQNLAGFYRDMLIAKTAPDRTDLVAITSQTWQALCTFVQPLAIDLLLQGQQHLRTAESQIKNTTQPRLWLEVTLLGLLPQAQGATLPVAAHPLNVGSPVIISSAPLTPPPAQTPVPVQTPIAAPAQERTPNPSPVTLEKTSAQESEHTRDPLPSTETTSEVLPVHSNPDISVISGQGVQQSSLPTPEGGLAASSTVPAPSELDLEEVWGQVIVQVQPPSTQVLMRQQCRLIAFRTSQARIGVKTQPLLKLAQSKLPNLEAAFQLVFQRTVKVSLEVLSPDKMTPSSSVAAQGSPNGDAEARFQPQSPSPSPSPSQTFHPQTAQPQSPLQPQAAQPPVSQPQAAHLKSSPSQTLTAIAEPPVFHPIPQERIDNPSPSPGAPSGTASEPLTVADPVTVPTRLVPTWSEPDEVSRAGRRLAEFFRGQVVSLEAGEGSDSFEMAGDNLVWDSSITVDLDDPDN